MGLNYSHFSDRTSQSCHQPLEGLIPSWSEHGVVGIFPSTLHSTMSNTKSRDSFHTSYVP